MQNTNHEVINVKWLKSAFLTFLCLLYFIPFVSAHDITVPTNVYFGFGNACYINFNTQQTFGIIKREDNYWYFNGYGFQVQNGNMTITDFGFARDKLVFILNAPSGTISTANIYVRDKGKPLNVRGTANWTYNEVTKVLTVYVTHKSPQQIEVLWSWQAGAPTVATVWNVLVPLFFILSAALNFIVGVKHRRYTLEEAIWISIAFILMAFLFPIVLQIFYGG